MSSATLDPATSSLANFDLCTANCDDSAQHIERELSSRSWMDINLLNWQDYPEKFQARVRGVAGENAFFLEFEVYEPHIRATKKGCGPGVCEDSCVEWFVSFDDGEYFNFEFNPIGAYTIQRGRSRHGRYAYDAKELPGLRAWGTEGQEPFSTKHANGPWKLWATIPYHIFGLRKNDVLQHQWKCNFYKCGEMLPCPHFQSFAPIESPHPDFHRPESFVRLNLKP